MHSVAGVDDRSWRTLAWGVAAVVAVLLGARLLGSAPDPPPVRVGATGDRSRPEVQRIYVHVAGAVRRPGLYRLRRGTRVADAVERAGGPQPGADLTATNLAAPLQDGQQVVVVKAMTGDGGRVGEDAPISLGSATVEQLDGLDGIGPTLAERIVEHRQQSGGFASLDQLADVEGIGEKRLEALKQSLSP